MGSSLPVALGTRRIRRKRHEGEWWFAVEDLCGALMDSPDGAECWRKLKRRLAKEGCEFGTLCQSLALPAADGTAQQVECVTLEGVFRIVQSVATPRAEVFKRWLAEVGRGGKKPQGIKTDLDSVFSMLGETAAVEIARSRDDRENDGNAVRKGDEIAAGARKLLESELQGKALISGN